MVNDQSGRVTSPCPYREQDRRGVVWTCIHDADHEPQAHRLVRVKGRVSSDSPPVIRWCWCGAAVAGMTVVEARQFARDHCKEGRGTSLTCIRCRGPRSAGDALCCCCRWSVRRLWRTWRNR